MRGGGVGVRVTAPGPIDARYPERYRTTAAPAPGLERASNGPKAQ